MNMSMDRVSPNNTTDAPKEDKTSDFDTLLDDAIAGNNDPDIGVDGTGDIAPRNLLLPHYFEPPPADKPQDVKDDWKAILGEGNDSKIDELTKPLDMAQKLFDNWEDWGMQHGVEFSAPPDGLPDEAKEVLEFFAGSPNAMTALDNGSLGGDNGEKKADGTITRAEVGNFIESAKSDLAEASKAFQAYKDRAQGADERSYSLAEAAAVLMANQSLVASAGPRMQAGAEDQRMNNQGIHPSNLASVSGDMTLSADLREAAALWKVSGMRDMLDAAGSEHATADIDRVVGRDNIAHWLANAAPTSVEHDLALVGQAAAGTLSNKVTSNMSDEDRKTFFDHLEDRSPREKAGVLIELSQAAIRLTAGKEAGLWDDRYLRNNSLDDDYDAVERDINEKMERLASDPAVKEYLETSGAEIASSIVDSSPQLKASLEEYFDKQFKGGAALEDAIDFGKLDDIGSLSPDDIREFGEKLAAFAQQASSFDLALGGDGKPDLGEALAHTGYADQIEKVYNDYIKSPEMLSRDLADGKSLEDAFKAYGVALAGFSAMLGDAGKGGDLAGAGELWKNLNEVLIDHVNLDDMAAFSDGNGEIDESKIVDYVNEMTKNDPGLFVDDAGQPVAPTTIASAVSLAVNAMRNGLSARDALAELGLIGEDTAKPPAFLGGSLNNGTLHGVSAVLSSASLITRMLVGDSDSTAGKLSTAGNALAMAAFTAGMYGKIVGSNPVAGLNGIGDLTQKGGALVGSAAGVLGGIAGIIGGVDTLKGGDKAAGGLAIAEGTLGLGLAALDAAAAIAGAAGWSAAGTLSAVSSALGPVGWAVSAGVIIAQLLIADAKKENRVDSFLDQLGDVLTPYGIGQENDWDSRNGEGPDLKPQKW
jgi:hypothetical protein